MLNRYSLPICFLLAILCCDGAMAAPNLVVIIADDCTFRDIGCYGGQASTPNIDRLADDGMRMTHCFQAAPMCSPTRHNILTGQYPVKTGAYPNHTETYSHVRNLTHHLRPLGYRLALSGKRHIGPRQLFDFEYSAKKNNPEMESIDRLIAECATSETQFCLFACSNEPHTPWNLGDPSKYPPADIVLPPYLSDTAAVRDGFSRYLAEITYFDDQVGQILSLLDKHAVADDTLVMVLSEQGNSMPFAKWTCYDSGLQSAMVVRWPGVVAPGSVSDAIVEYVDITPTLVDAGGAERSEDFDGTSFLPVLTGKATEHKELVFGIMTTRGIHNGNECYPIRSVRSRDHKLILNLKHDQAFTNACVRSPEFVSMVAAAEAGDEQAATLVKRYQYRPAVEFYDVASDPLEQNNLAEDPESKAEIARLREALEAWMRSQGDQGIATEMVANHQKRDRARQEAGGKADPR